MARLFPALDPATIENPGERLVARALVEQLPGGVEAFHSFNWLGRDRHGTLHEGECDFVLVDPERGLLFIEVKGGTLLFDGREWVREVRGERRNINKDPFAQAQRAMRELVEIVARRFPGGGALPFIYGFAVAFPDCRVSGSLPPSIQPELLLDAGRLQTLPEAVRRAFASFTRGNPRGLTTRELESIREALFPRYQLLPVAWRKVEDQEERLRRLTEDQRRLLDVLANQPKAAIRGVAGSGKTILALAKAQALARAGVRTLLLCYNRPLKDWLQEAVPESFGTDLTIATFHGLTEDLCKAAGLTLFEYGDFRNPAFWLETAPEALMKACDRLGEEHKFDAVVIDEGQDFHELWWTSLEAVFRNPANKACYYVFYDPRQNLYVDQPSLPAELGRPYDLTENCRNTVRIAQHCAKLMGYESRHREEAPLGDEPEVVRVPRLQDAFREAGKRVRRLCMPNQGGLKNSQVAVLAPGLTERVWPTDFDTVTLTKNFDHWRRNQSVLIASWARFKGLEADATVIIDAPGRNERHADANRYVARSRAKHFLTVIEVNG